MEPATLVAIGIATATLGAVSWVVVHEVRRQRTIPEGHAFRAAWARLDRTERRSVRRLVNKGEASDDPRLAAAAVAMVRLARAADRRQATRRLTAVMAGLLLALFVVATALAIWASVAGEEMVWFAWYVAGLSLLNLAGNHVINPWLRRRQLERLAAAERGNLEALGGPST